MRLGGILLVVVVTIFAKVSAVADAGQIQISNVAPADNVHSIEASSTDVKRILRRKKTTDLKDDIIEERSLEKLASELKTRLPTLVEVHNMKVIPAMHHLSYHYRMPDEEIKIFMLFLQLSAEQRKQVMRLIVGK